MQIVLTPGVGAIFSEEEKALIKHNCLNHHPYRFQFTSEFKTRFLPIFFTLEQNNIFFLFIICFNTVLSTTTRRLEELAEGWQGTI
jgi:hypothetical protein